MIQLIRCTQKLQKEIDRLKERTGELLNIEERLKQFADISNEDSDIINKAHREKGLRVREIQALGNMKTAYTELNSPISALKSNLDQTETLMDDSEMLTGPNQAFFKNINHKSQSNRKAVTEKLGDAGGQILTHTSFLIEKSIELKTMHQSQDEAFYKSHGKI